MPIGRSALNLQAGTRERTVPWWTSGNMYSRLLGHCGVIAPERGIISYSLSPIVPRIFLIIQETTIFPPPRVLHCPPTIPCRLQGALIAIWDISAATISHGKDSGNSPNTCRSGTKSQASYRQDMGLLFSFGVTLLLVYFHFLSLFLGFHNTLVLLRKIGWQEVGVRETFGLSPCWRKAPCYHLILRTVPPLCVYFLLSLDLCEAHV